MLARRGAGVWRAGVWRGGGGGGYLQHLRAPGRIVAPALRQQLLEGCGPRRHELGAEAILDLLGDVIRAEERIEGGARGDLPQGDPVGEDVGARAGLILCGGHLWIGKQGKELGACFVRPALELSRGVRYQPRAKTAPSGGARGLRPAGACAGRHSLSTASFDRAPSANPLGAPRVP